MKLLDYNTGEVLEPYHYTRFVFMLEQSYVSSLVQYERHVEISGKIGMLPYRLPLEPPTTSREVDVMTKTHVERWHVLMDNLSVELSLKMGLTTTDQKVYLAVMKKLTARNYAKVSATEIMEDWGIPSSSYYRAVKHLQELKVIDILSDEITEVHPYFGWIGDYIEREEYLKVAAERQMRDRT